MSWRQQAACGGEDPELFFPSGVRAAVFQVAQAKAVCRRCPVEATCLSWALQAGVDDGVWGGQTEEERRAARRRGARGGGRDLG